MSDIQITISTTDANSAVVIQRVTDSLKGLGSETTKTTDAQKGLASSLPATTSALSDSAIQAIKAGAAFAGVALSIKGVWSAAEEAARRQEVKQGFKELAASVGLSGDEIIAKMRKATGETVSNGELMKAASKTITLGVVANADEMARLMEIARSKSRGLHQTTVETFNQLVDAINRGTPKALKPLGIDLPSAIDKSISKMGDAEKKATILGSVLETEGAKIERLGGVHDTAADKFRRFDVAVGQIKGSLVNLALELTPVIELVAKLTRTMADFITMRDKFAGLTVAELQKAKEEAQKLLDVEIEKNKAVEKVTTKEPDYIDGGDFRGGSIKMPRKSVQALSYSSSQEAELRDTIKAIDAHLETAKKSEEELRKVRKKYLDGLNDQINGDNDAINNDSLKEKKETFEALSKAMRDAFEEMQKYASADDLEQMGMTFADLAHQAEAFIDALGMSRLEPVRGMLIDLAQAAGMLSGNLQKAGAWMSGGAQGTVAAAQGWIKGDVLGERYSGMLYDMATGLWQNSKTSTAESMFGGVEGFMKTFWNAMSQPSSKDKAEDTIRAVLEKPLARVFNDAMVQGLEEGDFFSALEKGLKRIVYQNISDAVTVAIFGGSSSAKAAINGATGTGGTGGLLSGLTNAGPLWKNGTLQTGNLTQMLGTNLILGYATNKLFGEGGLFGGRHVHGQEAVGQASDINSQVDQAVATRKQAYGIVGLSDETFQKLRDVKFWTAGYTWDDSGDGVFSKKTRTYALDASKALSSLAEFNKVMETATKEAAKREFEINITGIDRPFEALRMTIVDLKAAYERAQDEETRYSLALQIAQAERQKADYWQGKIGDYTSFLTSNPYAGNSALALQYKITSNPDYEEIRVVGGHMIGGYGYPFDGVPVPGSLDKNLTPEDWALAHITQGYSFATSPSEYASYTVGGKKLNAEEFESWAGTQLMMAGLKNQYSTQLDISKQLGNGTDIWDVKIGNKTLLETYDDQLSMYQQMMDELAEKIALATTNMEERASLFESWNQAAQSYYKLQDEALDIELQKKEAIKAKQDKLRDDQLSSLLSFAGELGGRNGDTYNILSAPESVTLLQQLKDANAGKNPELTMLLDAMIARAVKKAKWG